MSKFQPGTSGNPLGRPRKNRTGPDALRQDLLRQSPAILARLVAMALDGDVSAAKEVLSRCLPPLKPRDQAVTLPLGQDLSTAGRAVLEALGAGELSPDQASSLASTIGALARAAELIEFEKRLSAIESDLNERKQS